MDNFSVDVDSNYQYHSLVRNCTVVRLQLLELELGTDTAGRSEMIRS